MEFIQNLELGFAAALSLNNLLVCLLGCLLGTAIGVLPGLGPAPTIAMLLPLTYSLPPVSALIMLAGIYYGSQYGGSTTAILVNLPGESSSVVTCIDGYQMARRGRAGAALAIAAIGSFVAGSVATLLIAGFAPTLSGLATEFGPAEYFSLVVLGLASVIVLGTGSLLKSVCTLVMGLIFSTVGTDRASGAARFTFGSLDLADGLEFAAIGMGCFAFAEIVQNLSVPQAREIVMNRVRGLMPTRDDLRVSAPAIARGTVLGSLLGILPGGGAILASWAAYVLEKRVSKHPEEFGHGAIAGVAAPESANNASVQTSFIPMLTLGIPPNATMALMIGSMMMHGIVPGPQVIEKNPSLFWGLIASMWVGNLMLVVLNLPLVGIWVRLLRIPYAILFPAIVVICCIGAYGSQNDVFDVYVAAAFGVLAFVLTKLDCSPVPLILGFILGPLLEDNCRRALILSRGDPSVFVTNWRSAVLLMLAAGLVIAAQRQAFRGKREAIFAGQSN